MNVSKSDSFWKKIFKKEKKPSGKAGAFDRAVRSKTPPPRRTPSFNQARESTGIFIAEAVKDKRFETAAFTLVAKGKSLDAEQVGDRALQEGKFVQAIQIFEKIGHVKKYALANEISARDCLNKEGPKKMAAGRLYAAVQAYGKLLSDKNEDRVLTLKKMALICEELAQTLSDTGDLAGSAETYLYGAQLFRYLSPLAHVHEHFTTDPDFFARVDEKLVRSAEKSRDAFRRHVDADDVDPASSQGKKVIEKMKSIEKLLEEIQKK